MRLYDRALCILKAQQLTTKGVYRLPHAICSYSPVSLAGAHQLTVSRMPAFSVYLEGTRSHNEGRVSTSACYLLLAPRVCTLVLFIGFVCLSVCPCSNSLLDGLFVPQTIRRNKRVIRISLIERFSLRCRDTSVHSAGHFLLAENEHAHYITTTWPSGRGRCSCVP